MPMSSLVGSPKEGWCQTRSREDTLQILLFSDCRYTGKGTNLSKIRPSANRGTSLRSSTLSRVENPKAGAAAVHPAYCEEGVFWGPVYSSATSRTKASRVQSYRAPSTQALV